MFSQCPIDTRKELASNVIIMGGTAMLPGFKHSLLTEIKMLLDDPRYSSKLPLKEIKIHNPPAKENYVAWLGGKIYFYHYFIEARGSSLFMDLGQFLFKHLKIYDSFTPVIHSFLCFPIIYYTFCWSLNIFYIYYILNFSCLST